MIPLSVHKQMWTVICVCPFDENTSYFKRFICYVFLLTVFVLNVGLVFSSLAFVMEFWSSDLEGSLHATFQFSAHISVVYLIIVQIVSRQEIASVFHRLSKIYDKCVRMESYRLLKEANEKSEWLWSFYLKFMSVVCGNTVVLSIVSVFAYWLAFRDFNTEFTYHPYKMILPWNLETPFGYLGEICYQVSTGGSYMFINATILLLFIAICIHHQAFFEMYIQLLQNFNRVDKQKSDTQTLCDLIVFHDMAKSWLLQTIQVYSPFVLFQLICFSISLACVIFQLDLQLENFGFDAAVLVTALIVFSANPFLYCFYGKLATDYYGKMANLLFESDWQHFSVDLQKYLILMIANMQIPLQFHGFGISVLNLETFAKMFKSVISYYLMFKTISSK